MNEGRRTFLGGLIAVLVAPWEALTGKLPCVPPKPLMPIPVAPVAPAVARTVRWTGAAGNADWNDVLNWMGGQLPGDGDEVLIPHGSNVKQNDLTVPVELGALKIEGEAEVSMDLGPERVPVTFYELEPSRETYRSSCAKPNITNITREPAGYQLDPTSGIVTFSPPLELGTIFQSPNSVGTLPAADVVLSGSLAPDDLV